MSKIERLKATRAAHRGVVTKLERETDELLTEATATNRSRLDVIICLLEAKLKTLNEIDDEIIAICPLEDITNEIEESEEKTAQIIQCKKKIEQATQSVTQVQPTLQNVYSQSEPHSLLSNAVKPRLPKLSLPKFRGDVTKWRSFWDSFSTSIHENSGISTIDKFNYLNSLLEGNAARTIQGLALTTSNYNDAVEMLKERFGKTQIIISAHMDEILKIQACTDGRLGSLRYVYDNISVHVRGLASLGVSSNEYGSLLIPVIMSKLPNEIRIQISRNSTSDVWKIEELLDIIKKELEAREASEGNKTTDFTRRPSPPNNALPKPMPGTPTSATFFSGNQSDQTVTIRCAFCEDFHYSASCKMVVEPEKRREILQRKNRCFICLRIGHRSNECSTNKTCRNCNKRHHQSICDQAFHKRITSNETNSERSEAITTATLRKRGTVLLQTATALASNEDGTQTKKARILFDNGSQRSYVSNHLKSRLNLKPYKTEMLHLNTFGEQKYRKQRCEVVKIRVVKPGLNKEVEISALTFPVICSSLRSKVDVGKFPHLETLELADDFDNECDDSIDILIGSDHYWNIVEGDTIRGQSGPIAVSSKLGWLLSGPGGESVENNNTVSNLVISGERDYQFCSNENDQLLNTLKNFWETETIGIKEEVEESIDNSFIKDLSYDGKRYVVGLPWKEEKEPIPSEYQLCHNRLNSLHHKLKRDPELLREYDQIIKEQLQMGIIEEVPIQADDQFSENVHYLPHHAVLRRDRETTKVRIVYDGSAKSPGINYSLNDCLQVGPNLIPQLFDVLVKFRSNPIALTADIEKAFLMVSMNEASKNMLRFLWFKNPSENTPEVVQLRFCRLVFGLRPSPSILSSTIRHHLNYCEELNPELSDVINLLRERLYVDDFLGGADSTKNAETIYKNSKEIMSQGGFNLRKWNSNSKEVLDVINSSEKSRTESATKTADFTQEDESYAKSTIGPADNQDNKFVKVLGVNWNTETDDFLFNFNELVKYAKSLPVTKRSLLKLSAKVFDPLGLLSPFVIQMKCLFQTLCIEKIDWDQELHTDMLSKWKSFLAELESLNKVKIPRCYFVSNLSPISIQLHGFSDASKQAYAAVVYLRSCYDDGRVVVSLVCSKTRVSPVKEQTIPRLELLGACILTRLMNTVQKSLPEEIEKFYWTDSKTTLCWITNDKPWKQYVTHRVAEIRNLTAKEEWRHCPGSLNPADLPSRGITGHDLVNSSTWWNGPQFLQLPETEWPRDQSTTETNDVAMTELVKNAPQVTHVLTACEAGPSDVNLTEIINCDRFSTLDRLLRVTAYALRFVSNLKRSLSSRKNEKQEESNRNEVQDSREVNAKEIVRAESLWLRTVQANSFSNELNSLRKKNSQPIPRRVEQFALFLDENGMLRCRGRINNATLPPSNKNPVLLPSKHPYVDLIIRQTHDKVKHSSVNNTLTTIRERFWILRGRQAVKRLLRRCVTCRRLEGLPYTSYNVPDLPSVRVSEDPPFTHTGIDFAGPLFIRRNSTESDNEKCYVCLFTCASTRAVHLELTRSLSVESFLLAFRRFTSRRGLPATLMSDNGQTFRGSSKEIVKIARSKEVMRYLAINGVSWKFIVEKAPWWGGFWERLIQSVKRCLKKSIGRTTLSYDELNTLLIEVESVINSRPLTYVEDDQDGVSFTLSPSHLVNGRRVTNTPNDYHFEIISTNASLTRRARHHRHLLQQFTVQWRKVYLLNLRERHSQISRNRKGANIDVGDVVILKNESTNRMFWKLAKVEQLLPGKDGLVRAAVIKVSNSDRNPRLLKRSVKHLYPLEVNFNENSQIDQAEEPEAETTSIPSVHAAPNTRPRRNAAITGELLRRFRT